MITIRSFFKYIKWQLAKHLYSKDEYAWFIAMLRNKEFKRGNIMSLEGYSKGEKLSNYPRKRAVYICDGKVAAFGLADRLRGILSTYIICEEYGIEFNILFTAPFNLERYLIPNKIDWIISPTDLNYNLEETSICLIDSMNGSDYEAKKQEEWFRRELKKDYKEFHIRTNAHFSYKYDYARYFDKLFTPSELLDKLIRTHKNILGDRYISTSFRFLDLLGDFNETNKIGCITSDMERDKLINRNIEQIKKLHNEHPEMRILVNSDSCTFLEEANKLEFTYIISGTISHMDSGTQINEEAHDKTFIDFFMIANACEIYLLKTEKMHDSGFPYAASLLYNKPFKRIEF